MWMASATYECVKLAKWEHLAVSFACVGKMGIDELDIGDLKIGEPPPQPPLLVSWACMMRMGEGVERKEEYLTSQGRKILRQYDCSSVRNSNEKEVNKCKQASKKTKTRSATSKRKTTAAPTSIATTATTAAAAATITTQQQQKRQQNTCWQWRKSKIREKNNTYWNHWAICQRRTG